MTDHYDDLEIALETPEKVRSLRLKKQTLDGLPEEIEEFPSLERLDVSRGSYAAFPGPVGINGAIQTLLVSRSCISTLTDELGDFENLEELDLSWNEFSELPESIGRLEKLRVLRIERSPLTGLPDAVGALSKLKSLELAGCELRDLPSTMGGLQALQILDLTGSELGELPHELRALEELRILRLSNNNLVELPEDLAALSKLVDVDLSGNDLRSLPEAFLGDGGWQKLESLSLANNTNLDLVVVLKRLASNSTLQHLNLSGLKLVEDGELPENLRRLIWRHAGAGELPAQVFELEMLEELDLAFGEITAIDSAIERLRDLRTLDLTAHQIKVLPDELGKLKNLEVLKLGSNELRRISDEAARLPSLKTLDLSFNQLERLPRSLSVSRDLEVLDLENNRIATYEQIGPALAGCENLERVKLVGNPITLDARACRRLRDDHPQCDWELKPGKALHRIFQEARRQLAVGQIEEARQNLESIAGFETGEGGDEAEEFMAYRARSDAKIILDGIGG